MSKKDLIDYIMNTPENTNPAILSQMIDEIAIEQETSNDFSICTGTFINDGNIQDTGGLNDALIWVDNTYSYYGVGDIEGDISIVLYKGHQISFLSNIVSISGNITLIEDETSNFNGAYDITGDFIIHYHGGEQGK